MESKNIAIHHLPANENWLGRIDEGQRLNMKDTGQRLMALLLQYNGRAEGGEVFVVEGQRLVGECSQVCAQLGFTLQETVQVFLLFRRSILEAIHETGSVVGCEDYEGQRLFRRANDFLDAMLIALINRYMESPETISNRRNLSPCK